MRPVWDRYNQLLYPRRSKLCGGTSQRPRPLVLRWRQCLTRRGSFVVMGICLLHLPHFATTRAGRAVQDCSSIHNFPPPHLFDLNLPLDHQSPTSSTTPSTSSNTHTNTHNSAKDPEQATRRLHIIQPFPRDTNSSSSTSIFVEHNHHQQRPRSVSSLRHSTTASTVPRPRLHFTVAARHSLPA